MSELELTIEKAICAF